MAGAARRRAGDVAEAWWWAGPDLSLVQPVASHVDVMRMLGQGLLCAFGAWFYWWLLGRQPIVRERAGDLGAEPGELRGA